MNKKKLFSGTKVKVPFSNWYGGTRWVEGIVLANVLEPWEKHVNMPLKTDIYVISLPSGKTTMKHISVLDVG